jgi:hypothetical protein
VPHAVVINGLDNACIRELSFTCDRRLEWGTEVQGLASCASVGMGLLYCCVRNSRYFGRFMRSKSNPYPT